jgi:hypothetical protein
VGLDPVSISLGKKQFFFRSGRKKLAHDVGASDPGFCFLRQGIVFSLKLASVVICDLVGGQIGLKKLVDDENLTAFIIIYIGIEIDQEICPCVATGEAS